jgi:spectinomycin phosphotransferase
MLEKPDLPDEALAAALRDEYALPVAEIAFLPLGADLDTAVYRVVAEEGSAYFLKLRSGTFDDAGVAVSRLLHDRGVAQVIPPIPTRARRLWTRVERFALVLYRFGRALRGIHASRLPGPLARRIRRETFSPVGRDALRRFQARAERESFEDPVAAELAALLRAERGRITELVERAEALADALRARAPATVLCHGDMHAGNVLLGADGALHVVDWDTLVFAPREHDFEQIGGRWGGQRASTLFYDGYGPIEPDLAALAYYRYHRIVEDLAVTGEQILATGQGGANRALGLELVVNALRPGQAVDVARRMDRG